jgi:hypothetical protein
MRLQQIEIQGVAQGGLRDLLGEVHFRHARQDIDLTSANAGQGAGGIGVDLEVDPSSMGHRGGIAHGPDQLDALAALPGRDAEGTGTDGRAPELGEPGTPGAQGLGGKDGDLAQRAHRKI